MIKLRLPIAPMPKTNARNFFVGPHEWICHHTPRCVCNQMPCHVHASHKTCNWEMTWINSPTCKHKVREHENRVASMLRETHKVDKLWPPMRLWSKHPPYRNGNHNTPWCYYVTNKLLYGHKGTNCTVTRLWVHNKYHFAVLHYTYWYLVWRERPVETQAKRCNEIHVDHQK